MNSARKTRTRWEDIDGSETPLELLVEHYLAVVAKARRRRHCTAISVGVAQIRTLAKSQSGLPKGTLLLDWSYRLPPQIDNLGDTAPATSVQYIERLF